MVQATQTRSLTSKRMGVPEGLNLTRWWAKAQCLGRDVETLSKHDCWGCPVQRECIWIAITEDDRLADHALFIRGGLAASKREELWWWSKRDNMKTYIACLLEADRSEFAAQRRGKNKTRK